MHHTEAHSHIYIEIIELLGPCQRRSPPFPPPKCFISSSVRLHLLTSALPALPLEGAMRCLDEMFPDVFLAGFIFHCGLLGMEPTEGCITGS